MWNTQTSLLNGGTRSLKSNRTKSTAGCDSSKSTARALGRPVVGEISGSLVPHLKELRASKGGALRVLFTFDPLRTAILLVGGDKTGQWNVWYRQPIPEAEALYDEHLEELRREGLLPPE